MTLTADQLARCCVCSVARALQWLPHLLDAMADYEINTPPRQAAFLAQIGHESGGLRYVKEIWGPTPAQARYEGRADLGNTQPGDGFKYRGRGLIQVTGRTNYRVCGAALLLPLEEQPELLELLQYASRSAAWFWESHGLNALADAGEFERITRRINGGVNGLVDRMARLSIASEVLA